MIKSEWEDEYGKLVEQEDGSILHTEQSQKWHYENPTIEVEPPPSVIELLKQENAILQLAIAETIEKQEVDKINNQIALAEVIESLTIKGVL